MSIETLSDIAEELADQLGVYGECVCEHLPESDEEPCRSCRPQFVASLIGRMKDAAEVERMLSGGLTALNVLERRWG